MDIASQELGDRSKGLIWKQVTNRALIQKRELSPKVYGQKTVSCSIAIPRLCLQVEKSTRMYFNLATTRNGVKEFERKFATVEKIKKEAQAKTNEEEQKKMLEKAKRLELANNSLWQKISRRLKKEAKLRSIDKAAETAQKTAAKERKKAAKKATKQAKRDERMAAAQERKAAKEAKKAETERKKSERAAAKAEKARRADLFNDPMSGEYE